MDDSIGDDELDDLSWNLELKKLYDDDSWATGDVEVDKENDAIAQNVVRKVNLMDYPELLLQAFQDKPVEDSSSVKSEFPSLRFPYPKRSILTHSEMERFLKHEKMFKTTQSISEVKQNQHKSYKDYKVLQSKVLKEQAEFQQFLLDISPCLLWDYNRVDPEAEDWVRRRMLAASSRVKRYKQYFVHKRDFGIVFVPFKNDPVPFPIEKLTKTLGNVKCLNPVTHKSKIPNPMAFKPERAKDSENCWKKDIISEDINAERLALAWDADIVIGLGALLTLADNHAPFPLEWEIPVKVRTFKGLGYSKEHKIAFIDKSLPPRRIHPRERNWSYFKEVVKELSNVPNVGKNLSSKKNMRDHPQPKNGDNTLSNDEESSDEILQLDGANDHGNSNAKTVCKFDDATENSEQGYHMIKIVKKTKPNFYGIINTAEQSDNDSHEMITQVDGSNDDIPETTNSEKSGKSGNASKANQADKKSSSQAIVPSFWTHPKKSPKGITPNTSQSSDAENVVPFSTLNARKSWTTLRPPSPDEFSSSDDPKEDEPKQQKSSMRLSSSELSFGVLPDSALTLPEEREQTESDGIKSNAENAKKGPSIDNSFATRRSNRRNSETKTKGNQLPISILQVFSKNKQDGITRKKAAMPPVSSSKRKKGNSKQIIRPKTESSSDNEPTLVGSSTSTSAKVAIASGKLNIVSDGESNSDDEPLINVVKKKQQPRRKVSSDKVTNRGKKNPIKLEKAPEAVRNEKGDVKKHTASSSDILGQILGVETPVSQTRKEVTSAWASQAETMHNADINDCYSADELSLQQPATNDNVSYVLWKYAKKRVLIRYSLHGTLKTPSYNNAKNRAKDSSEERKPVGVTLKTKLEYQPDYAFENLTVSEICRDLLTMHIKRPSKVVRARIDPHKREILDVEWTISLRHLQERAEKAGYNPAITSKLLTKVFDMVAGLDKGDYILSHRENEPKMSVEQSVDEVGKNVVYDLHKGYMNPGRTVAYTQSVPWVPGDPHKPRKFHIDSRTIPLMFEPKDGIQSSKLTGNKGNRKKKKK